MIGVKRNMKAALFILLISFAISCKKEKDLFCVNAEVRWGGDPAADGFGWHLFDSIGGYKVFIPKNLPDSLKIDGLPVNVCMYQTKEKFYCECARPLNKYHITSIRRL